MLEGVLRRKDFWELQVKYNFILSRILPRQTPHSMAILLAHEEQKVWPQGTIAVETGSVIQIGHTGSFTI